MASLFNQTNIAPGTAFSSGSGSGGSNFNTINVSTISFTSAVGGDISTYNAAQNGLGGVLIGTPDTQTQPVTANALCFGKDNYLDGKARQSIWNRTGLTSQGLATGTQWNILSLNSQTVENSSIAGASNETVSMFRLSTLGVATGTGGNGQQINMVALASTLKSVYPSIVL